MACHATRRGCLAAGPVAAEGGAIRGRGRKACGLLGRAVLRQGEAPGEEACVEHRLERPGGHDLVASAIHVPRVFRLEDLLVVREGVVDKVRVRLFRQGLPDPPVDLGHAVQRALEHLLLPSIRVRRHDQHHGRRAPLVDRSDEAPQAAHRDRNRVHWIDLVAFEALVLCPLLLRVIEPIRQQDHVSALCVPGHGRRTHQGVDLLACWVASPTTVAADLVP
mmetsp:Transcript_102732/g.266076  ORF Transcript_102732/g.266076 Transcript_102732/m.266076 type:complete len:221 (+) Transcript_102732:169-831(+)